MDAPDERQSAQSSPSQSYCLRAEAYNFYIWFLAIIFFLYAITLVDGMEYMELERSSI